MSDKKKLSKSILEMKFMKRTKEKIEKEADDAASRAMYSNEITDKMLNEKSKYIIEYSFVPCENLREGRFSFHGMNPEIERILEIEIEAKRQLAFAKEKPMIQQTDISDRQMANTYYKNMKITNTRNFSKSNSNSDNFRSPIGISGSGNRRKLNLPEPKNYNKKKSRFIKTMNDDYDKHNANEDAATAED